ncbi:MAG: glycosyltransferase family 9 protein, partial [Candidatus Omnitrophica bacterium]|nr:glycosyltransferase family 9 protein [Candidatus Omnitrophota bacterium]
GPMHIAVAAGTESVALFGPVDERVYGPFSPAPGHVVVKKDTACRPCYKNFKLPDCNFGRECLNSITTDEVFKEVLNLLGKGGN